MKFILIIPLLVAAGCTGPIAYRQAKLPDGSEIRTYHAGAVLAPSVTVVAYRAVGSTNWTLPNTFSGPGLVPGASTGGGIAAAGALVRPASVNNSTIAVPPAPVLPPKLKKHWQD